MMHKLKKICFLFVLCFWMFSFTEVTRAEAADLDGLKKVMQQHLYHPEIGLFSVKSYGVTKEEADQIWKEICYEDPLWIAAGDFQMIPCVENGIVTYISMYYPYEDYEERYEALKPCVQEIMDFTEQNQMTDLERVVYFNDYLAYHTAYSSWNADRKSVYGTLVNHIADCEGYTDTFILLCRMSGIECGRQANSAASHVWNVVKIDGEWYEADICWNDPVDENRKDIPGKVLHTYLLRSTKCFMSTELPTGHYYTDEYGCTSEKYADWFVHDVNGYMQYQNGYWYYIDSDNAIVKSKIDGTDKTVIVPGGTEQNKSVDALLFWRDQLVYAKGTKLYSCNYDGSDKVQLYTMNGGDGFSVFWLYEEENVLSVRYRENTSAQTASLQLDLDDLYASATPVEDTKDSATDEPVFEIVDDMTGATEDTLSGYEYLESMDVTDISNWKRGYYSYTSASYTNNSYRLCLNDYVAYQKGDSFIAVAPSEMSFVIRELDIERNVLQTVTVRDGKTYIPGENAVYLAISLIPDSSKPSYAAYESLFDEDAVNLITVATDAAEDAGVIPDKNIDTSNTADSADTVESLDTTYLANCNLSDFSLWKKGFYRHLTAEYCLNESFLCLNEFKKVTSGEQYSVTVPEGYYFTIRELDADQKFIQTVFKYNGVYTPSKNTAYVAVFISTADGSKTNYAAYEKLFQSDTVQLSLSSMTIEDEPPALGAGNPATARVLIVSVLALILAVVLAIALIISRRRENGSK